MEAKRWLRTLALTFIVVGLFATILFSQDSNDAHRKHTWEKRSDLTSQHISISSTYLWLKNAVLDASLGLWQFNQVPIAVSENPPQKPFGFGLSPNLSSCHKSIAKADYEVYCCPPKVEGDEPFVDFKFPDPSITKRVRRPIHKRDKNYVAKYTRALKIMKSLPYDDPRSYARQADMHCIYCTGAYNQKHSNALLNIHRSWYFFPWHRMYLYFHERILAKLIDDESFSLSFWNWDHPEGMVTPELYMHEPFVDKERSDVHFPPPRVADIGYHFTNYDLPPQEQISKNLNFMYNQMVSGAKKVELFMGCTYKPGEGNSCDGPGTIELAPHNALHSWVGKESNRFLENMGVFYTAARDPIFWAHHSNIDRLWEVWQSLRNFEPEIVDPDWLDSHFFFHDENAQLVRIKVRDILNVTMLGYSYETRDLPWLNAKPKPSIDPAIACHTLNTRNKGLLAADSSDFAPNGKKLDSTITVKVSRPTRPRKTEKESEEEEVLVVYGIDIKEDMLVKFDVYVNTIDASMIGAESREFAGTYINVPKGVTIVLNDRDDKARRKSTLKLGISELLQDLQANADEFIWVTIVPRGGSGVSTTIDGIRIEYMA